MHHKYQLPIESERLNYKKLTADDIKAWEAFFINNPLLHFVGVNNPKTPEEESKIWIERQIQRYEETGVGMLGAFLKSTDQLIGNVGLLWREDILGESCYEIGYSVIPDFWKKGYAVEMATTFRQYFEAHEIGDNIISIIHIDNIGSQKVAERNGMSRGPQFEYLGFPCYRYRVEL